jgi:hypothetical protein
MRDSPTPLIGLAALIAMFVIPFLPDWLFEGPRTTKHWPHRHVCGDCGAPWTNGHICAFEVGPVAYPPLRAELRRADPGEQESSALALKNVAILGLDDEK